MIFILRTAVIIIILSILPLITNCGKEQLLSVHVIDVGQGDSILIKTPNSKNILIDAGDENSDRIVKSYLKKEKIKKLDMVFATHPDTDHIGSLDYIINNFQVDNIYMPETTSNNSAFNNLINACDSKNLNVNYLYRGDYIDIDDNILLEVLNPSYIQDDTNLNSLVLKLTFDDKSFLFTGDSEIPNEIDIVDNFILEDIDFLKVAHHGSSSSTSTTFLSHVTPDIAVISCGYKNQYGHPHQSTLDNLATNDILIFRTDLSGDLVFYSDGDKIFTKNKYN